MSCRLSRPEIQAFHRALGHGWSELQRLAVGDIIVDLGRDSFCLGMGKLSSEGWDFQTPGGGGRARAQPHLLIHPTQPPATAALLGSARLDAKYRSLLEIRVRIIGLESGSDVSKAFGVRPPAYFRFTTFLQRDLSPCRFHRLLISAPRTVKEFSGFAWGCCTSVR